MSYVKMTIPYFRCQYCPRHLFQMSLMTVDIFLRISFDFVGTLISVSVSHPRPASCMPTPHRNHGQTNNVKRAYGRWFHVAITAVELRLLWIPRSVWMSVPPLFQLAVSSLSATNVAIVRVFVLKVRVFVQYEILHSIGASLFMKSLLLANAANIPSWYGYIKRICF